LTIDQTNKTLPKTPKTPNRQKPFRFLACQKPQQKPAKNPNKNLPKTPTKTPTKNSQSSKPFSQFTATPYIPHPI
jgi:hypothetical protein